MDLEGRVALNYHGLTAAVGGYTGKLSADAQNVVTNPVGSPIRTASRFSALVAYVSPIFRVGGEYFYTKDNSKGIVLGAPEDAARGASAWASVQFTPKWAVLGRVDYYQPNRLTFPSRYENFYLGGIDYTATSGVDLALIYKRDVVKSSNGFFAPGAISTQDASGLGSTVVGGQGSYDEFGLFGRFAF